MEDFIFDEFLENILGFFNSLSKWAFLIGGFALSIIGVLLLWHAGFVCMQVLSAEVEILVTGLFIVFAIFVLGMLLLVAGLVTMRLKIKEIKNAKNS